MIGKKTTTRFGLVLALVACSSPHAQQAEVRYTITIDDAAHHLATITASFPAMDAVSLDLHLPAWRTGKYKILNFATGVSQFEAQSDDGRPLAAAKVDKSTWRVQLDPSQALTVRYQLYANQLSDRTRHIDETHAFFDAAATLVYAEQFRHMPASVGLQVPTGWVSRSGLERRGGRHQFIADDYDTLVDSPIETGQHSFRSFEADGRDYELLIWGQGNHDEDRIIDDLKAIAIAAGELWGAYPFQRYLWMLHLTDGSSGATEHVNSTIIQVDRFAFAPRSDYLRFLSTAAHEFIHTWNVKAYRPEGIARYDYQQENYTSLLWLVEGSTSYLSPLLLARAGIVDGQEFLDSWAQAIERHRQRPGRLAQSPEQASFDAWLDESNHWDSNAKANIYAQGMIASWLIDITILRDSNMARSYLDLHRLLYQRFPVTRTGFKPKDVLMLVEELSGRDQQSLWDRYIAAAEEVPVEGLLEAVGLAMQYGTGKSDHPPSPWTGMHFSGDARRAHLSWVEQASPAWQAGLTVGDELIALNGFRIDAETLPERLKDYPVEDEVELTFFRQGRMQSATMTIHERTNEKFKLVPVESPTAEQMALFEAWSGLSWQDLTDN